MKKITTAFLLIFATGLSSAAFAGPQCQYYPQNQRMGLTAIVTQAQKQNLDVIKAKEDDNCYEIKAQKKGSNFYVENKYDMKTGQLIHSEEKFYKNRQR